jgi:hypothetical protein
MIQPRCAAPHRDEKAEKHPDRCHHRLCAANAVATRTVEEKGAQRVCIILRWVLAKRVQEIDERQAVGV